MANHNHTSSGSSLCNYSMVLSMKKPWMFILLLACCSIPSIFSFTIPYIQHCNSIVSESESSDEELDPSGFLQFSNGYYRGREPIFGYNSWTSYNDPSVAFFTKSLYKTESSGVFKVKGKLIIFRNQNETIYQNFTKDGSRWLKFKLEGFWSQSSGNLCMVGSRSIHSGRGKAVQLSAVFKLNYPSYSTIQTSLVTGSVECLEGANGDAYFQPITILAFSQKSYKYTMLSEANSMCSVSDRETDIWADADSLKVDKILCEKLRRFYNGFRLEYDANCRANNCNPFNSSGFLPKTMFVHAIQCSGDGRLRFAFRFSNKRGSGLALALAPEATLVGEGEWNEEKKQLCMVGCRLLSSTNSLEKTSVGDCKIGLSLRFPSTLSLRNRNLVTGQIWSTKTMNDSGYFKRFTFGTGLDHGIEPISGLKYNYTETDNAQKSCTAGTLSRRRDLKKSGRRYPDGSYFRDMTFYMYMKNTQGEQTWCQSNPLTIGERLNFFSDSAVPVIPSQASSNQRLLKVAYTLTFTVSRYFKWDTLSSPNVSHETEINLPAEGVYDTETGILCLIGCLLMRSNKNTEFMDCKILIDIQLSPFNSDSSSDEQLNGTIKSTRGKSDPFYFEPLELFSEGIYAIESAESMWRMDLEIVMVLIFLTLGSILIALQIFHSRRHPQIFPSISLLMLLILTLGYMIPLLLNFEALFSSGNKQALLYWSGRWVEINEVTVRVVTMLAFILQLRLLHLTWSARLAVEGTRKGLWVSEKKALYLCLTLYFVGGLISCFLQWKKLSLNSMWAELRSFAGLVLDWFLLPQVLLNLFWGATGKALAPSFYIGNTIIRAFPHAYDVYRPGRYIPQVNSTYIYADPGWDFHSTAWDIVVPIGGLLLAILIFLQQRFGGRFILPPRFREVAEYEKIPVGDGSL